MHTVVAFGAADAEVDVSAGGDAGVGVSASNDDGENDGTASLSVAPPEEGGTAPHDNSLYRSPRSASMSMLKSRAAV